MTVPFGRGVVVDFDERAGLGRVRAEDGAELPFHCVAIADGSRVVPVGAGVWFRVAAGLPGRWEARVVGQLSALASPGPAAAPGSGRGSPSPGAPPARPETAT